MIRKTSIVIAVDAQAEANEKRKRDIIVDLYNTGRIGGLYFGKASKSKGNPIKHYIKSGLFKKHVTDMDLVDDCYNELFYHLQKMPAAKFCGIVDTSPDKLIATALRIVALKCFAKCPRLGRPNHSLIEGILFASREAGATEIDTSEIWEHTGNESRALDGVRGEGERFVLTDESDEPSEFEQQYGFTPEQIIDALPTRARAEFYRSLKKQAGRPSKDRLEKRAMLAAQVLRLKNILK